MKQRKLPIFAMAFSLLFILGAVPDQVRAEEGSDQATKKVVAPIADDGVQRVEVIGGEFYFKPNHIVVKVNHPVELLVKKTGGFVPHNIIIKAPDAGMDFDAKMGKDFSPVKFTPTKTGKYTMYCDKRFLWFKTHQHKGMEGLLEVVE